ncbi:MAG: tyrosine-protein phosphatase [Pseudomonadota bacterium]
MALQIILGPRPGKKSKDAIQKQGVTDIVTLLSDKEQPASIQKLARNIEANWHHFPIAGGHLDTLATVDLTKLFALFEHIEATRCPVVYLHCSAGLHRTGFVTHLILRNRGLSWDTALARLQELRPVTAEQVGEERLALAEAQFLNWSSGKIDRV